MAHWKGPPAPLDLPEPVAGPKHYVSEKRLPAGLEFGRAGRVPVKVSVDGQAIAPGEQTASALALLGVDTDELDRMWGLMVIEITPNVPNLSGSPLLGPTVDDWALDHQAGMGWQIEVAVTQDSANVVAIDDLAYANPYEATRTVTLWANEWNVAPDPTDITKGRVPTVITRTVEVESGAAVGALWSGVSDDEITATIAAAAATEQARRDLRSASHEMELAIKVADSAWEGDLAEQVKLALVRKHELLSVMRDVVGQWDDMLHDLIPELRKAKRADEELRGLVIETVGTAVVLAPITYGVGSLVRGLAFVGRFGQISKRVADARAAMAAKVVERAGAADRTRRAMSVLTHSARIAARTAGDLSATVAIRTAQGKPITGEDALWSLLIGGVVGHGSSELAKASLKAFTKRTRISLRDVEYGAAKGAGQEAVRAPARGLQAGLTDASLGSVLVTGAIGVPAEAAKHVATQRLKGTVIAALRRDPKAMAAAEQVAVRRIAAGTTAGKTRKGLIDEELEAMTARRVDPLMDYLYGATVGGIAKSTTAPPEPSTPSPAGTVAQPTQGP
jgi:hypothetical protein